MKRHLLNLISKFGYQIEKVPNVAIYPNPNDYSYAPIKPSTTYSPWISDDKFMNVYETIKPHTLVDIYRCYELWQLTEQAEKNVQDADYLEVGAWQGGTSGVILSKLKNLKSTSTLYIADTFEGVVKTGTKDNYYAGGEHSDTSESIVLNLLQKKLQVSKYQILKGIFPEQTGQLIPVETKFRFCHIDVDVYQGAKEIFEWVWPKLINGGIIVFDDYGFNSTSGVTVYVEEIRKQSDSIVLYNLNGHAIVIKIS